MSVAGRRLFQVCRSASGTVCRWLTDGGLRSAAHEATESPGPAPAGGPISCTDKKWGKEAAGGYAPLTPAPPPVGLRPKSAAPRPRISGQADSIPPAAAPRAQCLCRRVSGTVPGVRLGEARPLLRGAQRPRGGGKPGGTAARARRAHVSCGPCPQLTPRSVKPMRVTPARQARRAFCSRLLGAPVT